MQISLNGENKEINDGSTLAELIAEMQLGDIRYAVEINEELIPRSEHGDHVLNAGDEIEVVKAIGGG